MVFNFKIAVECRPSCDMLLFLLKNLSNINFSLANSFEVINMKDLVAIFLLPNPRDLI